MGNIRVMNVNGLDLNLVKILDALLNERSVGAAGRQVGLSQPAASHALRRLREVLGDPLLVPGQGGSVLTPRAEALREPARRALAALEETFRPPAGFDPGTARRVFTLASTDFVALVVMPRIWPLIARDAPGVELDLRTVGGAATFDGLRTGAFDLALGVLKALPRDVAIERLFEERFVLVVRQGHPLLEGALTLERLAGFPAVLVAPQGDSRRGYLDSLLAARGLQRRIAVTVPQFLLAPHLLLETDLTLVLPRRVAEVGARPLGLALRDLPEEAAAFHASMAWHRRLDNDPALVWLRALIGEAAAGGVDRSRTERQIHSVNFKERR
jgi:DNA-binding transcriptional LysR family regulator